MARAVPFTPSPTTDADRAVRNWLLGVAALVGLMVTIGGATRLTGSGLSITEWQPIMGAMPPIGEAAWLEAFAKYKTIPQYAELNKGMSLEAFKAIFWWEWGHRLLGRLIGIAFAVPLAWFWFRGRIRRELKLPLLGLLALGALQGFVGWFMVQSGLSERVSVSQYRLALHLAMAFLVLGGLLWLATGLDQRRRLSIRLRTITGMQLFGATLIMVLVFVQVIAGAFVAGLKAGLTYNTWPLMDGHVVPAGLATLAPWYMNLFENVTAVQFNHRMLAYLVTIAVLWHAAGVIRRADDEYLRATSLALVAVVLIQVAIGIWTLLWVVPLPLALLHQAGAALLFAIAVMHRRVAGWSRAAG
jgi:cytochrome c oxidase assembly protein subunit 15